MSLQGVNLVFAYGFVYTSSYVHSGFDCCYLLNFFIFWSVHSSHCN